MSEVTLNITGMTCQHCVKRAQTALENADGVSAVSVTLEPSQAVVDSRLSIQALKDIVEKAGYEAVEAS